MNINYPDSAEYKLHWKSFFCVCYIDFVCGNRFYIRLIHSILIFFKCGVFKLLSHQYNNISIQCKSSDEKFYRSAIPDKNEKLNNKKNKE